MQPATGSSRPRLELLGHRSLATTARYTQIDRERLRGVGRFSRRTQRDAPAPGCRGICRARTRVSRAGMAAPRGRPTRLRPCGRSCGSFSWGKGILKKGRWRPFLPCIITALLEASPALETLGLQIRLTNGTAQMFTGRIHNEMLSAFIAERVPVSSGAGELTQAALEVLSCIAFKQPISQGEIDQIFGDTDKRHLVSVLRQLELVEEFAGLDGRLRFATTGKFLDRFGLASLEDLKVKFERV